MKRILLMMLVLMLAMSLCTGCMDDVSEPVATLEDTSETKPEISEEDKISEVVEEFFYCYNNGDYEGLEDCLSEKQKVILEKTIGVIGELVDFDMSSLMSVLFGASAEVLGGDMLSFETERIEIAEDEESAEVYGNMNVNMSEVNANLSATIKLIKEEDNWKIELINPRV